MITRLAAAVIHSPGLIPGVAYALWGVVVGFIAYQAGVRRGLNRRSDAQKEELQEARHQKLVAEERLESERLVSKRLETALEELVRARRGDT